MGTVGREAAVVGEVSKGRKEARKEGRKEGREEGSKELRQ